MDVDHVLWHRSEEDPRYKAAPTHLTVSRLLLTFHGLFPLARRTFIYYAGLTFGDMS